MEQPDPDLRDRLTELEQRVAALEGANRADADSSGSGGAVSYQGRLTAPVELEWQMQLDPAQVLALDDTPRTEVLTALAHPVRIAIVRLLMSAGAQTAQALQTEAELGSTGQLYHHLKGLTSCGIVEQDKRGTYRIRPQAAIPALVLITASSDVAGQLR